MFFCLDIYGQIDTSKLTSFLDFETGYRNMVKEKSTGYIYDLYQSNNFDTSKFISFLDFKTGYRNMVKEKSTGYIYKLFYNPFSTSSNSLDTNRIPFLDKRNNFTKTQTFDTLIANFIFLSNQLLLKNSIGDTCVYFNSNAGRFYIKDLTAQTVITSTSVSTNNLFANVFNGDTIRGHSPIYLDADSTILKNKLFARNILVSQSSTNTKDTSSIYIGFTTISKKPNLTIKQNNGTTLFDIDTAGNIGIGAQALVDSYLYMPNKNIWVQNSILFSNGNASIARGVNELTYRAYDNHIFTTCDLISDGGYKTKFVINNQGGFYAMKSITQTKDTSAFNLDFTTITRKPSLTIKQNNGTNLFSVDTTGRGYFRDFNLSLGDSTTASLTSSVPTFTAYYGGNTNVLGDPVKWMAITFNGIQYQIPLYKKP